MRWFAFSAFYKYCDKLFTYAEFLISNGLRRDSTILELGCGIGTITGLVAEFVTKGKIKANFSNSRGQLCGDTSSWVGKARRDIADLFLQLTFRVDRFLNCVVQVHAIQHWMGVRVRCKIKTILTVKLLPQDAKNLAKKKH